MKDSKEYFILKANTLSTDNTNDAQEISYAYSTQKFLT